MLFEVQDLSKRFGDVAALTGVSFHVRAGEILGLIGPNGAGKSTLFECLAGVLPSDAGRITARPLANPLLHPGHHRPLERATGRLGARLHHRLLRRTPRAPRRNRWPARPRRPPPPPHRRAVQGQRKRALLAIGLLTPQPVLLIDEPFDGLDLRQTRDVAAALRAHAARGRTLFLSIHQISDAARLCDRFVLLSNGAVRGEGTLPELAARAGRPSDSLEEVFLALT